jgi:hypothetical protein
MNVVAFEVLTAVFTMSYYLLGCNVMYPEDGDGMFLRNVCWLTMQYTELYPGKYKPS